MRIFAAENINTAFLCYFFTYAATPSLCFWFLPLYFSPCCPCRT